MLWWTNPKVFGLALTNDCLIPWCCHAGSVASLAVGLLFGLLAVLGAYMESQNPQNIWLSLGKCIEFKTKGFKQHMALTGVFLLIQAPLEPWLWWWDWDFSALVNSCQPALWLLSGNPPCLLLWFHSHSKSGKEGSTCLLKAYPEINFICLFFSQLPDVT